jgi:16S rRNA (uracil1498-N3)-methyltransferase
MQRYFVSNDQIINNTLKISGDDSRHIIRVMRMKEGDSFICCNENGETVLCQLDKIENEDVYATIVKWYKEEKELPIRVTIAHGLPKADKMELVVQKGTELGASQFLPFLASRSIVKWDEKKGRKKTDRLQKIAKEAAEQSHRTLIPKVELPYSFKQLLDVSEQYHTKIIAFEEEAKQGETSNLSNAFDGLTHGDNMLVVIGPEGGLSKEEVAELKQHGFIPCGLGPRILRTETAPLYILAAVSYYFELKR